MKIMYCQQCGGKVRSESIGWKCESCQGFIDMQGGFHPHKDESFVSPMTYECHEFEECEYNGQPECRLPDGMDCPHGVKAHKPTNADLIRAMSDTGLAKLFYSVYKRSCIDFVNQSGIKAEIKFKNSEASEAAFLKYLQSPAVEED